MTGSSSGRLYRFGSFEAHAASGELRKRGLKIRLQTQPFRVLLALLDNAGDVVTRETLQKELWPDDTFVDFDHGLNSAVNKIRQALGDTASSPRFVETEPRRGYRFIAPVEAVDTEPSSAAESAPPPPPAWTPLESGVIDGAPSNDKAARQTRLAWILGAVGATVGVAGFLSRMNSAPDSATGLITPVSSIRILAGQQQNRIGANGKGWLADQFFVGGSAASRDQAVFGAEEPFIFRGERYGSFEYGVPIQSGRHRVRLYFAETYYGASNPGGGGPGSRRFDVAINGEVKLEALDVFGEAGGPNRAVIREFLGIRPDSAGRVVISFMPLVDNAMVSAIEIEPE